MQRILVLIAQRLGLGVLILLLVSLIIMFVVELLPGDTCQELMGQTATPSTLEACRAQLGLNEPAHIRYLDWLGGILTGDMGQSLANDRPIADMIDSRIGNTFFLAGLAAAISVPLSLLLGVLAALYRNSIYDRVVNAVTLTSVSVPEFFVAYILIFIFAVRLGMFPGISNVSSPDLAWWDLLYRSLLPAVTLTLVVTAHMMRMTRASIINLLASPYIEMARLKGIGYGRIVVHHALPNALAPIINVIAVNLAYLIVGVVVVEVVFVYPGLGQLLVDAVSKRDMPMIQAGSMIFAAVYVLLNLFADIMAIVTNPRLLHPK
jgi:peptide/nickel transport system permease protein